jgi:hypothetical protein
MRDILDRLDSIAQLPQKLDEFRSAGDEGWDFNQWQQFTQLIGKKLQDFGFSEDKDFPTKVKDPGATVSYLRWGINHPLSEPGEVCLIRIRFWITPAADSQVKYYWAVMDPYYQAPIEIQDPVMASMDAAGADKIAKHLEKRFFLDRDELYADTVMDPEEWRYAAKPCNIGGANTSNQHRARNDA